MWDRGVGWDASRRRRCLARPPLAPARYLTSIEEAVTIADYCDANWRLSTLGHAKGGDTIWLRRRIWRWTWGPPAGGRVGPVRWPAVAARRSLSLRERAGRGCRRACIGTCWGNGPMSARACGPRAANGATRSSASASTPGASTSACWAAATSCWAIPTITATAAPTA